MAEDGRARGVRSLFGVHNVPAPIRARDAARLQDRTAHAQERLGLDKGGLCVCSGAIAIDCPTLFKPWKTTSYRENHVESRKSRHFEKTTSYRESWYLQNPILLLGW